MQVKVHRGIYFLYFSIMACNILLISSIVDRCSSFSSQKYKHISVQAASEQPVQNTITSRYSETEHIHQAQLYHFILLYWKQFKVKIVTSDGSMQIFLQWEMFLATDAPHKTNRMLFAKQAIFGNTS